MKWLLIRSVRKKIFMMSFQGTTSVKEGQKKLFITDGLSEVNSINHLNCFTFRLFNNKKTHPKRH